MANQINTLSSADAAWRATLKELELQMTKATFNTWLKDTEILGVDEGTFVIGVRNAYAVDWLENRLNDTIQRALNSINNAPTQVRFVVATEGQSLVSETSSTAVTETQDADAVRAAWPDIIASFADHQKGVQPRDCLRWLSQVQTLWAGTGLQVWCDDEKALANLNRLGGDWVKSLADAFNDFGLPISITLLKSPSKNGSSKPSKNGSGNGRKPPPGNDEKSITYRNVRPPTDPLGSFVKVSHYATRFWRPYLRPILFDLLLIISDYDYEVRVLHKPGPKMNDIHRKLGHGDIYDLVGRKASNGRAGKYGWINELRDHHLCHHVQAGRGRGARHFFDNLTLIDNLPLLTPKQVAKLDPKDQEEHREWLEMHSEVSFDEWSDDERETPYSGVGF